jgi:polysaccharide export outer membrane protein
MRAHRRTIGLGPLAALLAFSQLWALGGLRAQDAVDVGGGLDVGGGELSGFVGSDASGYVLSPGDVISVRVFMEPEFSGKHRISDGGTIAIMYNKGIQAAGRTTDELAQDITTRLRALIRRPMVQVDLDTEASTRKVAVSGAVVNPGSVTVPFGGSLASAVLMAGIAPQADLTQVRVTRAGQASFVIDLNGIRQGDAVTEPTPARDGDLIYVPKGANADFSVFGMVIEPGTKPLEPEEADRLTVMRALNAAGGVKEGANLSEATILRQAGETESVNLDALLNQGDMSQNLKMQAGDSLVVRAADKITVAGEVTEPTSFPAPEPMKLLEVLAQAKGLTPQADMQKAMVVGGDRSETVDLEKLWVQGDMAENVVVQPGESVIVPTRDPAEVLVVGAVEKPGAVDLHLAKDQSVLRAVQTALPRPTADLRRVLIQRAGVPQPIVVDLKSVTDQGQLQANVQTMTGDLVFVPELKKVYAAGSFMIPGAHPLTDGMTALELVGVAGGFREDALPGKMRLIRTKPGGAAAEAVPMDFRKAEKSLAGANVPLIEGDIVYVPSRDPNDRGWQWWQDIIWSAVGLFNLFR